MEKRTRSSDRILSASWYGFRNQVVRGRLTAEVEEQDVPSSRKEKQHPRGRRAGRIYGHGRRADGGRGTEEQVQPGRRRETRPGGGAAGHQGNAGDARRPLEQLPGNDRA